MHRISRFFFAVAAWAVLLSSPLHALSVAEMKTMETKVKLLVAKNTPSVVALLGDTGAGSGVVVSADGLILTAAHVSKGNKIMTVVFPNGKTCEGKVLGANYTRDVSLVKIEEPGTYPFVEIGDSDKLEATTMVVALGHPGGYDPRRTPPVRIGRISSKDLGGFLVSDCTLIGGDSGGPLFTLDGKVVGIHSSISQDLTFNRDAPVNAARTDWAKMLAGENWGALAGMSNDPRNRRGNRAERAALGTLLDKPTGVEVGDVRPKTPLEAAGLASGDVVLKIGGREIKTKADVAERLDEAKPGEKIEVTYTHAGEERKTEVTLISQAELDKLSDFEPRGRRERRNGR